MNGDVARSSTAAGIVEVSVSITLSGPLLEDPLPGRERGLRLGMRERKRNQGDPCVSQASSGRTATSAATARPHDAASS